MKELTIEQKAKAYDEALERAKNIYGASECKDILCTLETIFPELKESDDEKIRKELLKIVKESEDSFYMIMTPNKRERLIAWLEKQGEHANFLSKIQVGDKVTRNEAGVLVNLSELERVAKPRKAKPTDKVEPKFMVGEWIVWQNKYYKVNYNGCGYELIGQNGLSASVEYGTVDESAHLWTIQDAKDGDVLYYKSSDIEYIVMNKGVNKHGNIDSYFRYNSLNGFGVDIPSVFSSRQDDITPATKEQRDTLFAKMKEAGYKWDTEKKELRKIEQRPTYKVEPKSDFELSLKHIMEESIECGDTRNLKADAELLYNIAQEPAKWSEEDEKIYSRIYDLIHAAACANYDVDEDGKELGEYAKITNWFKSLKDRVQPKQEWREDDRKMLNGIIEAVSHHCYLNQKDIDWLKSLRPQPHWEPAKWSEEDNVMLKNTLALIETVEDINKSKDGFLDVKTWLKSLKDKYTWKPSDEQMETLRYACGGNYVNLGILESLYKELKQLKKL